MEQLGILDLLLPFLSEHLRDSDLASAPTVRNLARMGAAIMQNGDVSRPLALACLFADFHLMRIGDLAPDERFTLVAGLRARGVAKADTEQMRLLLEAVTHMVTRSRTLRRLAQRPSFAETRSLFELITPTPQSDLATGDP